MIKNRKVYIVDSELQYSMMFEIMALCCLTSAILLSTGLIVFSHYLGYMNGNPDLWSNVTQILEYAWSNYAIFLLLVLLAVLYITGALAILITHQIAGPVYRFLSIMEKVEGGDLSEEFKLRKGDHLQQVAEKIRLMITSYARNIGQIRQALPAQNLEEIQQVIDTYVLPGDEPRQTEQTCTEEPADQISQAPSEDESEEAEKTSEA